KDIKHNSTKNLLQHLLQTEQNFKDGPMYIFREIQFKRYKSHVLQNKNYDEFYTAKKYFLNKIFIEYLKYDTTYSWKDNLKNKLNKDYLLDYLISVEMNFDENNEEKKKFKKAYDICKN